MSLCQKNNLSILTTSLLLFTILPKIQFCSNYFDTKYVLGFIIFGFTFCLLCSGSHLAVVNESNKVINIRNIYTFLELLALTVLLEQRD